MRPFLRTSPFTTSIPIRSLTQRTITSRTITPSKSNPGTGFLFSSSSRTTPLRGQTILQRLRSSIRSLHHSRRGRSNKSSTSNSTKSSSKTTPEPDPTSLGGKLKKLSREYGWSAVGVYAILSATDFPFCYLLVLYLGTDRIGKSKFLVQEAIVRIGTMEQISWTLGQSNNWSWMPWDEVSERKACVFKA